MLLAQKAGVNIVNFVRSAKAAEELEKYGAEFVVVTEHDGWEKKAPTSPAVRALRASSIRLRVRRRWSYRSCLRSSAS